MKQSESKRILVIGAGGHGRSVAEAVLLAGTHRLVGFVDDAYPKLDKIWEYPVLGTMAALPALLKQADCAVVAIGNNPKREQYHQQLTDLGFELATVVHPAAVVSTTARLGKGVVIMPGAIVNTEAVLADGVIVNSGAIVDHHCNLGLFSHLGVGVSLAGGTSVGRGAWLQAGCSVGYGVVVEAGATIPPGSALFKVE